MSSVTRFGQSHPQRRARPERRASAAKRQHGVRLCFEPLEDRRVLAAATATALLASQPNPVYGQQETFTASIVDTSTSARVTNGSVQFLDGNTLLGTSPVANDGKATLATASLAAANHSITAKYEGVADTFDPSTSDALSLDVAKAGTTTTLRNVPKTASYGQPVMLVASVDVTKPDAATGKVEFLDNGKSLGTAELGTNGVATFKVSGGLSEGKHSITAAYEGDTNYAGSTSRPVKEKIVAAVPGTVVAKGTLHNATQTVDLNVQQTLDGSTVANSGQLSFTDTKRNVTLTATSIRSVIIGENGHQVRITGEGTYNGKSGYQFTVEANDASDLSQGRDTFHLKITAPDSWVPVYVTGGSIDKAGDIAITKTGSDTTTTADSGSIPPAVNDAALKSVLAEWSADGFYNRHPKALANSGLGSGR